MIHGPDEGLGEGAVREGGARQVQRTLSILSGCGHLASASVAFARALHRGHEPVFAHQHTRRAEGAVRCPGRRYEDAGVTEGFLDPSFQLPACSITDVMRQMEALAPNGA